MRWFGGAIGVLVLALACASGVSAHPPGGEAAWRSAERLLQQQSVEEPPLESVPRAECGPGDNPETGMQGRVPNGTDNFFCNLRLLSREGNAGGFKVHRFVDRAGRECAYYDSTLLFPTNAQDLSEQPTGAAVVDMSDPANPVRTDTLLTPAMQTPHESLILNEERGLLAAVMGNPAFYPGHIDVYDVNEDCRHPQLQSSLPLGLLGHESGFAPDGRTFYATSIGTGQITAVDLTNPRVPVPLWVGHYNSHGLTVSEDGNRAYVAALSGLIILDVSEVQARRPNPQVREVSRLAWTSLTIPQVAIPVTINGAPYLVEIDEFSGTETSTGPSSNGSRVGAARIIDISDEINPRVVSNIRLEVHQPENRDEIGGDPGAESVVQGYAGHYCAVPQREEPGVMACSFIASGLRLFDIRDPERPREIAYYTTPPGPSRTAGEPSNYAMSAPAFAPERGEIWYADGNTGFYALRVTEKVWPFSEAERSGCPDERAPVTRLRRRGVRVRANAIVVRGRARDRKACRTGLHRVQVSLARVRGRGCRFVKQPARYRLTKRRSCRRPVLFNIDGRRKWRFRFPLDLPRGRYRVQARSTDRAGNKETPRRRSIVSFRVR